MWILSQFLKKQLYKAFSIFTHLHFSPPPHGSWQFSWEMTTGEEINYSTLWFIFPYTMKSIFFLIFAKKSRRSLYSWHQIIFTFSNETRGQVSTVSTSPQVSARDSPLLPFHINISWLFHCLNKLLQGKSSWEVAD